MSFRAARRPRGDGDVATNLASLGRIAETGAQVVLPGHGEPFRSGVAAAVREARVAGAA